MPHKVKLLKMDIEGMEYEVLNGTNLNKIEYMVAEFHKNKRLKDQVGKLPELIKWINTQTNLLYWELCEMAE
jgi:hypothetical protein